MSGQSIGENFENYANDVGKVWNILEGCKYSQIYKQRIEQWIDWISSTVSQIYHQG